MVGVEGDCAVLDFGAGVRLVCVDYVEASVRGMIFFTEASQMKSGPHLVVGI